LKIPLNLDISTIVLHMARKQVFTSNTQGLLQTSTAAVLLNQNCWCGNVAGNLSVEVTGNLIFLLFPSP
jgi:hypothetical protein